MKQPRLTLSKKGKKLTRIESSLTSIAMALELTIPSKMKKDRSDTIRVDSKVKAMLKDKGLSIQNVFDDAIDKILKK